MQQRATFTSNEIQYWVVMVLFTATGVIPPVIYAFCTRLVDPAISLAILDSQKQASIDGARLQKWIRLPHIARQLFSAALLTVFYKACRFSHRQCQMAANGITEDGVPQYGTQENPTRVTGQFLNGRGPDEGVTWMSRPHPDWQPGDKQPNPWGSTNFETLDPAELGAAAYPLVISAITPRPIAFISSQDKDGVVNVSPYSYFNVMSHDPIHITIGHAHSKAQRDNGHKDSLQNILDTGEFVTHIISEWFLEAANHTCGPYDPDVDEMKLANLTPMPSKVVKPPRIAEAAVQMECKLRSTYDVVNKDGEQTGTIVIAEVVMVHLLHEVTDKSPHTGKTIVDVNKLRPMSRFGGNIYGAIGYTFEIPRPPKEAQEPLKPSNKEHSKEDSDYRVGG